MPDSSRLLTAPLRVTGRLQLDHLVTLVCADVAVRYARFQGREVSWDCATLAGDLAGQHEVDRELAREGQDRSSVNREDFVERVRTAEAKARDRIGTLARTLGVDVDLDAGSLDQAAVALSARTAFVRLYEKGLLGFSERVVDTCPRCVTAIDRADADPVDLAANALVLRLAAPAGVDAGEDGPGRAAPEDVASVDVTTVSPELLPAVVAILVPEGHPAVGLRVEMPLAGRQVPVVAFDVDEPCLVVPAHDPVGYQQARRLSLLPIELFDREGVARHDGPLDGLSRYAARAAARELLEADGGIVGETEGMEATFRCRRCRTVLIPRLGRHWTLPAAPLELAAADAVREGLLSFAPAAAKDEFLARAGQGGEWCLSYQVLAGQSVPAATCLDCGGLSVTVEPAMSCPRCMGTLSPDLGVLDARFVGAVWPLSAAGWPGLPITGAEVGATSLAVGPDGLAGWALTMAALGLCLAGVMPFGRVIVGPLSPGVGEGDLDDKALDVLLATEGPEVVRIALLGGGLDVERARGIVELLRAAVTAAGLSPAASSLPPDPTAPAPPGPAGPEAPAARPSQEPTEPAAPEPNGPLDPVNPKVQVDPNAQDDPLIEFSATPSFREGIDAAFAAGRPEEVLVSLMARLTDGLDPSDTRDVAALAAVLLGDGALPGEVTEVPAPAPALAVDGEGR